MLNFLNQKGITSGDYLILQIEDNLSFITVFLACIFGNIIPILIRNFDNENNIGILIDMMKNFNYSYLIFTNEQLPRLLNKNDNFNKNNNKLTNLNELDLNSNLNEVFSDLTKPNLEDTVLIQFTSGSTSLPKGISVSNKNIISNIIAITDKLEMHEKDKSISWLPLNHNMGLIAFFLSNLYSQSNQFILNGSFFMKNPNRKI